MPVNIFDNIRDTAVDTVYNTMGNDATWQPLDGELQTVRVGYSDATDKHELADEDYYPYDFKVEYRKPNWPGLKEAVDAGDFQVITVLLPTAPKNLWVREVRTKYDGNTCVAYCENKL